MKLDVIFCLLLDVGKVGEVNTVHSFRKIWESRDLCETDKRLIKTKKGMHEKVKRL